MNNENKEETSLINFRILRLIIKIVRRRVLFQVVRVIWEGTKPRGWGWGRNYYLGYFPPPLYVSTATVPVMTSLAIQKQIFFFGIFREGISVRDEESIFFVVNEK